MPQVPSQMPVQMSTESHGKTEPTAARMPTQTVGAMLKTPIPATKHNGRTAMATATATTPEEPIRMLARHNTVIQRKETDWDAWTTMATDGTTPSMPSRTFPPNGLTKTETVMATTPPASNPMPVPARLEPQRSACMAVWTTTVMAMRTSRTISPTTRHGTSIATATVTTMLKTPVQ